MGPHEVIDHTSQLQECLGRGEALEMPHNLVSLFYVLVVALNRVVVKFESMLSAGYRHAVYESCYVVEVPIESSLVLPELVAHEGYQASLFRRLVLLSRKKLVNLRSYAFFEGFEEIVELPQLLSLDEFAAQIILRSAVDCVYAPVRFFPTFTSTSSRCIRPLTFGFGISLRSNFSTRFAYFLTQFRMLPSETR